MTPNCDRHRCIVPFCRATTGKYGSEWICSKHWRMTPKDLKANVRRIAREYRKQFGDVYFFQFPAGSEKRIAAASMDREWRIAWDACKDAAIYNSMMAME